jgi:hypothetical protein
MWIVILDLLFSNPCWLWMTEPRKHCTRCGGDHSLSRCPWPAPACSGACNQGRTKCTCR